MSNSSSDFVKALCSNLGCMPNKAERFEVEIGLHVDILQFQDVPYQGVTSVITNGLRGKEGRNIEVILTFNTETLIESVDINAFVATYIQFHFLMEPNRVAIGDYFQVQGKLIREYGFTGVYTTSPCYFSDSHLDNSDSVEFLWIIPIFTNEFEFIEENGVDKFESFLEETDPDLCELGRSPLHFN